MNAQPDATPPFPSPASDYVIRPGRTRFRVVFQLACDVEATDGASAEEVFAGAANRILDWLAAKFPTPIPDGARNLLDFDLDHHSQQQLQGVSLRSDGLWCARLVQPDAPYKDKPAVAGRTWTTDLALRREDESVRLAVRAFCSSAPYATAPITLTRPRAVVELAETYTLREVRPLDGKPWTLEKESELEALHGLLVDPQRRMPIVVLTQAESWTAPGHAGEYLIDPASLARWTLGFAHVVCIPAELAWSWTQMVGKVWSVYLGAVRTYRAGLDFENDSPFSHPRALPDRVTAWRHKGETGPAAFMAFLVERFREYAAAKQVDWGGCLFYPDARSRRAELTRLRIRRQTEREVHESEEAAMRGRIEELAQAHEAELAALRKQIDELVDERETAIEMGVQAENEAARVARANYNLQAQNDTLRAVIEGTTGSSADASLDIPETWEDMPDWIDARLAGRLVLHPRAVQGIKRARYEDANLVYRALLLLSRQYRNMRLGWDGAREDWEKGLQELGLRYGGSIAECRAGQEGDTYFVRYPPNSGEREFLEWHLCKGSAKDERHCLRIYFFWCENSGEVVVGWLPSHLDNRAT